MKVWPFVAVTLPLVLTPGVSTAVVLRTSVTLGVAAGLVTAAGLNASSCAYGLLTALGLPVVARRWPTALVLLRYGGGAYLLWLGLRAAAHGIRRVRSAQVARVAPAGRRAASGPGRLFVEGFVANTLNPPIAAFYLLILPQFVPRGEPAVRATLLLTAVHVSMAAAWHVAWAVAGGTLAARLGAGRPRATLEIATGAALTGLAIAILL